MFFDDRLGVVRVLCLAPLCYAVLLLALRVSGKRTLAKMNAFDLVVTVALGSTLASAITSGQIAFVEGAMSLVMLILLQFTVSWWSHRSEWISRLVRSQPRLLFLDGQFLSEPMREERVLPGDILQAMRSQGVPDLRHVKAVVLESDGSFSVLQSATQPEGPSTLQNVRGIKANVSDDEALSRS